MAMRVRLIVVILATLAGIAGASDFPRPPDIEHQIHFWRTVFADYSKYQVVVHDTVDLNKVYSVLDFRPLVEEGRSLAEVERIEKEETEFELARLRSLFSRFAAGVDRGDLTTDERRI